MQSWSRFSSTRSILSSLAMFVANTKVLNFPFFSSHARGTTLRVIASSQNGNNGVAGTSKGHEQANTLLEKAQDFGQKVAGAAGATVDKTVRFTTCTQCFHKMRYDA